MSSSSLPVKESFTDDQGTASTTRQPVVNRVSAYDKSWSNASNPCRLSDEDRFSLFKEKFGRSYPSQEEEELRFRVFRSNLRFAESRQELNSGVTLGVTQFFDLTMDEFVGSHCGLKEDDEEEDEIELREGSKGLIQ